MKKRWILIFSILLFSCISAQAEVWISEVCASNSCIFYAGDGSTPDWVELVNSGDEAVTLDGWALGDSLNGKHLKSLDGLRLEAGEYLVIALCDTDFALSADGEAAYLFRSGEMVDSLRYEAQAKNQSAIRNETGEVVLTDLPTPGMENRYLKPGEPFQPLTSIVFSEVLTSAAPLKNLTRPDFVELYNAGRENIKLDGYTIRLGMSDYYSYTLQPQYLRAKAYKGVYFAEDVETQNECALFHLPAHNAVLSLWNSAGELIDYMRLGENDGNLSCGRDQDTLELVYYDAFTFGKENRRAYPGRLDTPVMTPGGRYEGSVTVEVQAAEGCTIHYTKNGNTPTQNDPVYTGPLEITKDTALSVRAFKDGYIASDPACATYILSLKEDLPIICLVVDRHYLYDRDDGMLSSDGKDHINYLKNWEYPATFEYVDANGHQVITQRCGIGVQGDSSRGNQQKAFQVIARKAYGAETFAFNPFENRDFTEYKSFNIRGTGSEGTAGTRMRDAFLTSLAEGTNLYWCDSQPVLVYLNGELRGHYNLRERMNKHYIAQHEGITDEEVIDNIDLLTELGNEVRSGSNRDYIALRNFMRLNDLNVPENLDYVLSQMDVDSYFDYICFCILTGNRDISNSRFYRVPGGKWTWMLNDLDRAMEKSDEKAAFNAYCRDIKRQSDYMTDHIPFQALIKVPAMREKFLSRLSELQLQKFMSADLLQLADEWQEKIRPFVPYHMERWEVGPVSYWESLVQKMRKVISERQDYVVQYTTKHFNLTDEEVQKYFGTYLSSK